MSRSSALFSGAAVLAGMAGGILVGKRWGIPFLSRDSDYAISMYSGPSIGQLGPMPGASNPVISARSVTDLPAQFVADPFLIKRGERWSLFFEVVDRRNGRGCIGHASSLDGRSWSYDQIVLSEPFHLSYPFVFEWEGEVYMVPESSERYEVRLYRARRFPDRWELVTSLLRGPYVDSTLFRWNERWWMFSGIGWGNLHLFHAEHLNGPWQEHPNSPLIVANDSVARPGGRVITENGKLLRFAQDDYPYYGRQLRAFEIDVLSPTNYVEHQVPYSPLLVPGSDSWNRRGMHHLDAHQQEDGAWCASVDGFRSMLLFNGRRFL
ncbi:MAG: hypothetical protein ACKVVP_02125 [Chloroflexota bacterium]